jgi:CRISPR-associated Csx2 family protein
MGRIYISFLGTNDYSEEEYVFNDKSIKTRFIQQALIELFCNDFTRGDRLCFLLTDKARAKNWEPGNEKGLKNIIASVGLPAEIVTVDIPFGKSEDELWKIFNAIYETLNENDSVILDITHGFRSLPMLGFVSLYYARYLKNVMVQDIYYGALDARDQETGKVPIFRLTQFYNLIQWSSAADVFVNYGISDKLKTLALETEPFFHGSNEVAEAITKVTESMSILRGGDIVKGAVFANCKNKMADLEATGVFQAAFKPVFRKVKEKLHDFTENDSKNFLYAVNWYLNHKMIPQTLTMMQEGLLTFLMEQKNIDYRNKKNREYYSAFLQYLAHSRDPKRRPLETNQVNQYKIWGLDFKDNLYFKASDIYYRISQVRNDVNHCGFEHNATKYNKIVSSTDKLFMEIKELCQKFSVS